MALTPAVNIPFPEYKKPSKSRKTFFNPDILNSPGQFYQLEVYGCPADFCNSIKYSRDEQVAQLSFLTSFLRSLTILPSWISPKSFVNINAAEKILKKSIKGSFNSLKARVHDPSFQYIAYHRSPEGVVYNSYLVKEYLLSYIIADTRKLFATRQIAFEGLTFELYILNYVRHKNILRALHVAPELDLGRYQIFYAPHLTLAELYSNPRQHSLIAYRKPGLAQFITTEITKAVAYLHQGELTHNDISQHSVYIGVDGGVRLGDFQNAGTLYPRSKNFLKDTMDLGLLYLSIVCPTIARDAKNETTFLERKSKLLRMVQNLLNRNDFRRFSETSLHFMTLAFAGVVTAEQLAQLDFVEDAQDCTPELQQAVRDMNLDYMIETVNPPPETWLSPDFNHRSNAPVAHVTCTAYHFDGQMEPTTTAGAVPLWDSMGFLCMLVRLTRCDIQFLGSDGKMHSFEPHDVLPIMGFLNSSVDDFYDAAGGVDPSQSYFFRRVVNIVLGHDGQRRVLGVKLKIKPGYD